MINWFKRDPLLQGILILLTPIFIGIIIIVGLVAYGLVRLFDPNYNEFGPRIGLYKAKDCAAIDESWTDGQCIVARWMEGMYQDTTKTLDKVLTSAINQKEGLLKPSSKLIGYPKNASKWSCSANGNLVVDNTAEIIRPVLYKCWPK